MPLTSPFMMKLHHFVHFTSVVLASPLIQEKRDPAHAPLDVKIALVDHTHVRALIKNTGDTNLKVLKAGTILDSSPVEKVQVQKGDEFFKFKGVHVTLAHDYLDESSFQTIKPGETVHTNFDVAEAHDLSPGGHFDISTTGNLAYARGNSHTLVGSIPFRSNTIQIDVDGNKARVSRKAFYEKRTSVQDCSGNAASAIRASLDNCASMAEAAQTAALSGSSDRMNEYFKASDQATRNTVAEVFSKVQDQCSSSTSGGTSLYCSDRYNACTPGVIAYTISGSSYMVYCSTFMDNLPLTSSGCNTQSKSNTVLHETTHLNQVKGTSDYGGYGYEFVRSLPANLNINHADTYALFAQNVYANCL